MPNAPRAKPNLRPDHNGPQRAQFESNKKKIYMTQKVCGCFSTSDLPFFAVDAGNFSKNVKNAQNRRKLMQHIQKICNFSS